MTDQFEYKYRSIGTLNIRETTKKKKIIDRHIYMYMYTCKHTQQTTNDNNERKKNLNEEKKKKTIFEITELIKDESLLIIYIFFLSNFP